MSDEMESKSVEAEDLGRWQRVELPVKIWCIALMITLISSGYLASAGAFSGPTGCH